MGLIFNRRRRGVTLSKGGVSASRRAGRVTVSSRGRVTVRLGKGLSFRL